MFILMAEDLHSPLICQKFLKNLRDFFHKCFHLFIHQKYFWSAYYESRNHPGHWLFSFEQNGQKSIYSEECLFLWGRQIITKRGK